MRHVFLPKNSGHRKVSADIRFIQEIPVISGCLMDLSPTVNDCVYAGIDLRSLLHEVRRMTCFLFNYANIVYPKRKVKRFLLTFPFSFADGLSGAHRVLFSKIRSPVLQTPVQRVLNDLD